MGSFGLVFWRESTREGRDTFLEHRSQLTSTRILHSILKKQKRNLNANGASTFGSVLYTKENKMATCGRRTLKKEVEFKCVLTRFTKLLV